MNSVSRFPTIDDPELKDRLRAVVLDTWFAGCDPAFIETNKADVDILAFERYNACASYVVPWVNRALDLRGKDIVEVGCGTGSSTAAFARVARTVHGYDIDLPGVQCAQSRMKALGIDNARADHGTAETILAQIRRDHPDGTDVFLLYAVLEHQTLAERLEMLRAGWEMLRDDGLLVVVETPNRLAIWDNHTSLLPFFNMLPDELALLYYDRSPRPGFVSAIRESVAKSRGEGLLTLTRWGRGVSYHEFELVFGDVSPLIAATGYEPEMLHLFPLRADEVLLQEFFRSQLPNVPLAFGRALLNLIVKKGGRRASTTTADPGHGDSELFALHREYAKLVGQYEELRQRHERLEASSAVRLARRLDGHAVLKRALRAGISAAAKLHIGSGNG